MSGAILLVPSVAKGNGSGHLIRCLGLARALGPRASVYVPEGKSEMAWSAAELSLAYPRELAGLNLVTDLHGPAAWDLVVLDRRATTKEELAFWSRIGPVLALDEGGEARPSAHYLVDILPRLRGGPPNKASLGYLDLPRARRIPPSSFKRVLLSFGGEDPAGLTLALARSLIKEGLVRPADLSLVNGALRRGAPPLGLEGTTILGPIQDLKEHLSQYDLVFTQFGLTAFEAAWAGCGVVLLNSSPYHRSLARMAGFPEIGVGSVDLKALRRLLASPAELLARTSSLVPDEVESLADLLIGLEPTGPRDCPVCGGHERSALYRDAGKSYFRCRECGTLYLFRLSPCKENPYSKSYFFEEYRRQYGKTYLEDWPNLTRLARGRLELIEAIAAKSLGRAKGLSVLDIGCAYGPFLAAARERGQEPYGLDASPEAAAYVRSSLGIPAAAGDFIDPAVAAAFGGPFDVLSLWYVVEHFDELDKALRNAAALLRPGGILALSTPSGTGASARFDRTGFFRRSPEDHFTIWEPPRVEGILAGYGFRVERIRVTGHHPERLPGLRALLGSQEQGGGRRNRLLTALQSIAYPIGAAFSRCFGLGDTFEVYAIREPVPAIPAGGGATRREAGQRVSPPARPSADA
jgi:SAM-dependent methyltransferase